MQFSIIYVLVHCLCFDGNTHRTWQGRVLKGSKNILLLTNKRTKLLNPTSVALQNKSWH